MPKKRNSTHATSIVSAKLDKPDGKNDGDDRTHERGKK